MKKITNLLVISNLLILVTLFSCDPVVIQQPQKVESVTSFYLLNEGAWGANNASLDFYYYQTKEFSLNIFSEINPNIVGGLGDVGNDLKIYGSKLYAVINGSGLVEVMNAKTAQHIGKVEIANCRNITFYGNKAYVSSFAGEDDGTGKQLGFVAEIDTATLHITRTLKVGYQPEGLTAENGKLYVTNSGGYNAPNYDNRIFVIDIQSFTKIKEIEIAENPSKVEKDIYGNIYVLCNGDYFNIDADICVIKNDELVKNLGIYTSNFCVSGDSLYILSNKTDWYAGTTVAKYIIYNLKNQQVVTENFITDGTETSIASSYGIAVNPTTKDIFITNAKNYTTSGELFCFSPNGKKLWSVTTGVCPKYIAFLWE